MHVHACMYECMHECRYICVYVGIYTCMYVSMYTHIVCKYVCMYVCMCNVVWSPTLERHADQRWIRQKADDSLGLMAKSTRDATEATRQRFDKPRTTTIVNYLVISAVGRRQCVCRTKCRPTLRHDKNSLSLVKHRGALLTGMRIADGLSSVFVCLSVFNPLGMRPVHAWSCAREAT